MIKYSDLNDSYTPNYKRELSFCPAFAFSDWLCFVLQKHYHHHCTTRQHRSSKLDTLEIEGFYSLISGHPPTLKCNVGYQQCSGDSCTGYNSAISTAVKHSDVRK